ncbi:MAG: hypothetical protein H7068_00220 [Pedobacter sp.]|nr:hypothetical protein [Chitinophagaceae bacterium]
MITLLQIDAPSVVDVVFGLSFIASGFAITGYLLRTFSSEKVRSLIK